MLLVYKCLNGLAPMQLTYPNFYATLKVHDYFVLVPRISSRAGTRLKTYGDRAFSVAAPRLWNQLLPELRGVTSVDQFRTQLKTYLFKLAYDV